LNFAVEHDLDIIFASFIRKASDISAIREIVGPKIQIIAKIENGEGMHNFDEILKASDGIMVARGDLGIEIPPEKVFIAQKMMIAKCNLAGKAVICATQMLESMTNNPRPTRAEATDVANAVLDGADCVMLSGETARGKYPSETVRMMHRICIEAESAIAYLPLHEELCALAHPVTDVSETIAMAAVSASLQSFVQGIIVLTTTGETAKLIAKYRPQVSIIAVTRYPNVARQLHLYRGCFPFLYPADPSIPSPVKVTANDPQLWQHDVDRRFYWAIDEAKNIGLLKPGDFVVVVQGSKGGHGNTNTIKIIPVNDGRN
jgi:pyruvate kinase